MQDPLNKSHPKKEKKKKPKKKKKKKKAKKKKAYPLPLFCIDTHLPFSTISSLPVQKWETRITDDRTIVNRPWSFLCSSRRRSAAVVIESYVSAPAAKDSFVATEAPTTTTTRRTASATSPATRRTYDYAYDDDGRQAAARLATHVSQRNANVSLVVGARGL